MANTIKTTSKTPKVAKAPQSVHSDSLANLPEGLDYRQLFQTLPDRYIMFAADDPSFTIIEQNDAHATLSMVKPGQVIGQPLLKAYPDTSEKFKKTGVSDLIESLRKVLRTKKPDSMSAFRYDLKDDKGQFRERYFQVVHYPVFEETSHIQKPKLRGILQATLDVTEAIMSKDQLQQTERQLAEALDIAKVGTWIWDIKNDRIIADKNLALMFGMSVEEAATGLPLPVFMSAIHPADRERISKEIAQSIRTKELFDSEYRTIDAKGEIHWLLARGRIESDVQGKAVRFPGVLLDITDRKQFELNRSFLVQASTVLASSLDYKKTLKSIARLAVPDIADWCTVDILEDNGSLHRVAVAHKDPAKVAWATELHQKMGMSDLDEDSAISQVIRSGEPAFIPEITEELITKSARSDEQRDLALELELSALLIVPLKTNAAVTGAITLILAGAKRHFAKTDLDMAMELANHASLSIANARLYDETRRELKKREKLEEKLRIANSLLEKRVRDRTKMLEETNTDLNRSNQELQDFAYVASHDLQEPLRKIQAFGNLLEQEYGNVLGEGADYLQRMRNAAARMSSLITDLLAFSRVATKVQPFVPVDLAVITREVIGDLEVRIAETGGKVDVGKLPTIDADPMQMRQLLQNLIGNALKFHKPDAEPLVNVTAAKVTKDGKDFARLTVTDNGVGFDSKYLDRIFAVFQRLHSRDAYEGTGIGLAVCRKIVERHDGSITAKSQPGKGASFIVYLPLRYKLSNNSDH